MRTTFWPATPLHSSSPRAGGRKALWLSIVLALGLGATHGARVSGQMGGVSTDVEVASLLDAIEVGSAKQERLDLETSELAGKRDQVGGALKRQVRALYRLHRAGAPLAGGVDAVLRHVARVERLRRIVRRESEQLKALTHKTNALRVEASKTTQAVEESRSRLTELQAGVGRAAAVPHSDMNAVLAVRPSGGGFRPADDSGFYGVRLVDPGPATTFESLRGNLASPIRGDVRIQVSRREESDGPGLELQAPVGTPVRAAAAGRVAFSDRYGSYGRIVILDHGDGYYTVYGGLGAVEVRVGDDLSRDARIGSIGTDFSPSALFFEVRQGTRTLEPRSWLGL
jgi:septal ring factor EnvC (AmiA/AmiB activator)